MKKILKKLEGIRNIILFLDYDGTIVPIKKKPELARLNPMRRNLLKKIAMKIPVSVISGRALSEIKELVKLKGISLIGNHGYEILCKGKLWLHPEAIKLKKILRKTLKRIELRSKNLKDVLIEDKGLSGSVHFRLLKSELKEKIKKIVEEEVKKADGKMEIRKGKKVLEIRPKIDWDKGKGVEKLLSLSDVKDDFLKIYIGDDETDEDAFKIFGDRDIAILVGRRKNSSAKFRLKNVNEVWNFLKELLARLEKFNQSTYS